MDTPSLTQQHRGWTLLVTSLSVFMLLLDINVVNVALPEIRKELDASFTQLQWVLDAYALGLAAILVAAGSLADRIGRRRIFTIGFVIFTLASLACGLAWNVNVLIVSRFIQGIGGAILFAVGPALLGSTRGLTAPGLSESLVVWAAWPSQPDHSSEGASPMALIGAGSF